MYFSNVLAIHSSLGFIVYPRGAMFGMGIEKGAQHMKIYTLVNWETTIFDVLSQQLLTLYYTITKLNRYYRQRNVAWPEKETNDRF